MKKVLLVEDDIFLSKIYKKKLGLRNIDTESVVNGNEAVARAKEYDPDLIILDIILPGQNGFEVLRELKRDGQTRDVPVIVLTNLSADSDKNMILALGARRFMTKVNVSINEVLDEVEKELATV